MKEVTGSFADLLAQLEKACQFWGTLGYNLAVTRIGTYERELRTLIEIGQESRRNLDIDKRGRGILMLSEIAEFLYASEIAVSRPHLAHSPRIARIFSGPDLALEEITSEHANPRNTLLELSFAAAVEAAGLTADLSGTTDVKTMFKGVPIDVECKRPQNLKKAETAIRKAAKQLGARKSPGGPGIILVCIGKLLSEGHKGFVSEDRDSFEKKASDGVDWFIQETRRHWQNRPAVDAVMVRINVPAFIKNESRLCHSTTFRTVARAGISAADLRLLDEFDAAIHAGFPGVPM